MNNYNLVKMAIFGSSNRTVFLPWVGKLEDMIKYWVPFIHVYRANRKIVCCKNAEEFLFPSACLFIRDSSVEECKTKIQELFPKDEKLNFIIPFSTDQVSNAENPFSKIRIPIKREIPSELNSFLHDSSFILDEQEEEMENNICYRQF